MKKRCKNSCRKMEHLSVFFLRAESLSKGNIRIAVEQRERHSIPFYYYKISDENFWIVLSVCK